MPHYADGTEAKVGDQVFGRLYNTEGPRAGTIISITPGVDSCNAMVQYTEVTAVEGSPETLEHGVAPRMAVKNADGMWLSRPFRGEQHGAAGPKSMLFVCADYCAINELTKLG